jgi:hypothetical protein
MEQWRDHVLANSGNSYDLVHCAAALFLAEYGAEDESDWSDKLSETFPTLTGFQSSGAKSIARQIWPLFAYERLKAAENHKATAKWLRQSIEDGTAIVVRSSDEEDDDGDIRP